MNREHQVSIINRITKEAYCEICGPVELKLTQKGNTVCPSATPQHRIISMNLTEKTVVCKACGPQKGRPVWRNGKKSLQCVIAHAERMTRQYYTSDYRKVVADKLQALTCELCKFKAEDMCQLDVDHIRRKIDGGTDDRENLRVLCANCHRLKTKYESIGRSGGRLV